MATTRLEGETSRAVRLFRALGASGKRRSNQLSNGSVGGEQLQ